MSRSRNCALLAATAALILAILSIIDPRGLRKQMKIQREIVSFEDKSRVLADQNAALRREIEALSGDVRALERAAREDLGLIGPNEVVFNFEEPTR